MSKEPETKLEVTNCYCKSCLSKSTIELTVMRGRLLAIIAASHNNLIMCGGEQVPMFLFYGMAQGLNLTLENT